MSASPPVVAPQNGRAKRQDRFGSLTLGSHTKALAAVQRQSSEAEISPRDKLATAVQS